VKRKPRAKPPAPPPRCDHKSRRELRKHVWWCAACGAMQITAGPPLAECWLVPRADAPPQEGIPGSPQPDLVPRIRMLESRMNEFDSILQTVKRALKGSWPP
jgi:hypothetical protein